SAGASGWKCVRNFAAKIEVKSLPVDARRAPPKPALAPQSLRPEQSADEHRNRADACSAVELPGLSLRERICPPSRVGLLQALRGRSRKQLRRGPAQRLAGPCRNALVIPPPGNCFARWPREHPR